MVKHAGRWTAAFRRVPICVLALVALSACGNRLEFQWREIPQGHAAGAIRDSVQITAGDEAIRIEGVALLSGRCPEVTAEANHRRGIVTLYVASHLKETKPGEPCLAKPPTAGIAYTAVIGDLDHDAQYRVKVEHATTTSGGPGSPSNHIDRPAQTVANVRVTVK